MKTFMLHTYHAIRYGKWDWGWEYVEAVDYNDLEV